ncbi:MAG TPA: hypothetical protein VNE17_06195 [Nitrolancea sp.]|nr:hypothetical protein [Nitrolancea sp.]
MNDNQSDQETATSVLLSSAGIPVPATEIGKIAQMQRNAANARLALRAMRLLETEPVTSFAAQYSEVEDDHE